MDFEKLKGLQSLGLSDLQIEPSDEVFICMLGEDVALESTLVAKIANVMVEAGSKNKVFELTRLVAKGCSELDLGEIDQTALTYSKSRLLATFDMPMAPGTGNKMAPLVLRARISEKGIPYDFILFASRTETDIVFAAYMRLDYPAADTHQKLMPVTLFRVNREKLEKSPPDAIDLYPLWRLVNHSPEIAASVRATTLAFYIEGMAKLDSSEQRVAS
ncbi:MAG: hypothetical protein C9356_15065 [Oleiphilus sp.]|nr:MAG: hypothetical protein C9356_15065 [Oleiphilus sp.]